MGAYFLNLVLMLLLVAGLAIGSLWLWRRVQPGMALGGGRRERLVQVVDAVPMGTTGRLAVVEFGGRRILLAVSRGRIDKLADVPIDGAAYADAAEYPDAQYLDDGGAVVPPFPAARG